MSFFKAIWYNNQNKEEFVDKNLISRRWPRSVKLSIWLLDDLQMSCRFFDGEEGLTKLKKWRLWLDFCLTWCCLKNGFQVLKERWEKELMTPVLIMTAKESLDDKDMVLSWEWMTISPNPFYQKNSKWIQALLKRSGKFNENTLDSMGM